MARECDRAPQIRTTALTIKLEGEKIGIPRKVKHSHACDSVLWRQSKKGPVKRELGKISVSHH